MLRKIMKVLFSQAVIVGALLLIQAIFLIVAIMQLSNDFVYVYGVMAIVSSIIVISIVNSSMNPTYQIAWIIPIMVVPVLGGLLYLYIVGQKKLGSFNKKFGAIQQSSSPYLQQNVLVTAELAKVDQRILSRLKFMNSYGGYPLYDKTEVVYFPLGEDKWRVMLQEIEKAQHYIFLEYFIIGEGNFWSSIVELLMEKARCGVEVRLIYDGVGCLTSLPAKYPSMMRKAGIKCMVFNPFRPVLSASQNNRDHRKILVIDGHTAFNGGVNLADEYVNIEHPYGHWKDTAVMIKGQAAYSFTVMFLQQWQLISGKGAEYQAYKPSKVPVIHQKGFVMPFGTVPQVKETVGEFMYMDMINNAIDYVHIMTPYLILDHEMITALTDCAKRGVDVCIIMPGVADHWYAYAVAKSYCSQLIEAGVKIYFYSPGFLHSKTCLADGNDAIVGTINFDYRSFYLHYECATWMYKHPIIEIIEKDFQDTLVKCRRVDAEECRVGGLKGLFYSVLRVFAPLM